MNLKFTLSSSSQKLNTAFRSSLRRQVLAGFGELLLFMLLASIFLVAYMVYRFEVNAWQDRQQEAATTAALRISQFFESQESLLSLLAKTGQDELLADPGFLSEVLQGNPDLLELVYLDAAGGVVSHTPQEHEVLAQLSDIQFSSWFQAAQAGRHSFSMVQFSVPGEPYQIVAIPAAEGGVIAGRIGTHFLQQVVADTRFGSSGRIYIVDEDGTVLAHPNSPPGRDRQTIANHPGLSELLRGPGVVFYKDVRGLEGGFVAGARVPVEGANWSVLAEMTSWEFYGSSRSAWILIITISLVLYLLITRLASRLLDRLVLEPIDRLQTGARQVGLGNLGHRVDIQRTDEIGRLAGAFNQMAAELEEHEKQLAAKTAVLEQEIAEREQAQAALRELNERLEERVEERTAQLSQVNNDLRREVADRQQAEALLQERGLALQRKTYQQGRLIETARQLTSSLDVEEVLRRICQGVMEILEAQGCTIYLLEDEGRTLSPVVSIDPDYALEILTAKLDVDASLNGRAVKARRGQIINSPLGEEAHFQVPGTPVDDQERLIVAPLIVDDQILGTMSLNRMDSDFTEEELALTETFAAYASAALKNAQAHANLQNEVEERKRVEAALRESEARYMLAILGANDGLWDWDLKENRIYFSPRWKSMLGYEESEIGDSPDEWFSRLHPDDTDRVQVSLSAHLKGLSPHFESEHRIQHQDGNFRWVLTRGLAVLAGSDTPGGPGPGVAYRMAGSQSDITARKQAEEQLLHDAFHDALTGLPNRALFRDRLGRAIQRTNRHPENPFAVLFLDLDRFKVVNDSLGHTEGDQLLIDLASRLNDCLRTSDTAARLGGDEFVVLLEDIKDVQDAALVAERIRSELKLPFNLNGHEVVVTTSIGIVLGAAAFGSSGYERPEEVLRDADIALYRAKALGKDRFVVFDPSLRTRAIARLDVESELRDALERGEFRLHYQPICSLISNRITGFEALLRWQSPSRGLVPPSDFIPVAEETGLIVPIGEWVLHEACRQVCRWQELFPTDPPLTINVNISGVQFAHPALLEQVRETLEETGLDPACLNLEITESVFIENAEGANAVLAKLRQMGVHLQIDDFGTGYSSLAYLQHFPISMIKIDRSFISQIGASGDAGVNGTEIVKTIVALARDLGMEAVAEGVETPEQLAQLKGLDCHYGQGYLIAHPLDQDRVQTLLSEFFESPAPGMVPAPATPV